MPEPTTPRVFGWTGVSTTAQAKDDRFSLPKQRELVEQYADSIQGRLVHVAVVSGHSRNYRSMTEMLAAFRKDDISALDELLEGIEKGAFDIVAVPDADRFARQQAPLAEIVHRITETGARIYCIADGLMVDDSSADAFVAMRGFFAAAEVRRLKGKHESGTKHRVENGLNGAGRLLGTHKIVKDLEAPMHQRIAFEETQRRLWDDVATLILEGVAWREMEITLLERFGHVHIKTGLAMPTYKIRNTMFNPFFWGHSAKFYGQDRSAWVYDETIDPPAGVILRRNVFEPVYKGPLADLIRQELKRRSALVAGRAKAGTVYGLTGLIVCNGCGARLVVIAARGDNIYWGCRNNDHIHWPHRPHCDNRGALRNDVAIKWIDDWLRKMIGADDIRPFFGVAIDAVSPAARMAEIENQIAESETQIDALIRAQSRAAIAVQGRYDAQIAALDVQIKGLNVALRETAGPIIANAAEEVTRRQALNDIAPIIDNFWIQSPVVISQMLAKLLGGTRFIMKDRHIVQVT